LVLQDSLLSAINPSDFGEKTLATRETNSSATTPSGSSKKIAFAVLAFALPGQRHEEFN